MRKAISLLLALMLCLALAAPALAAENPAANLTPEAAAAYLGVMENIDYSTSFYDPSFLESECRGRIIDIDNDGTEELVVRYVKEYYLLCDIWTIKNGEPVRLLYETLGAYAGAGPSGHLMLAESMGETWLCLYTDEMEPFTETQEWMLYQLTNGVYKKQYTSEMRSTYLDDNDFPTSTPQSVRYFIDKVEVSENEFSSRPVQEIKRILNCNNYGTVQDESIPFEDLIASLQKQASGITVTVNGEAVPWTDATPFIDDNDRTMVPLRAVADAMRLGVNWDENTREASFTGSGKTITFPIDSSTARTSDGETVTMDTAAVIVNDRTYAPIRYLAEYFGYGVDWDPATRTVTITG